MPGNCPETARTDRQTNKPVNLIYKMLFVNLIPLAMVLHPSMFP
jgi:hypothetical protein